MQPSSSALTNVTGLLLVGAGASLRMGGQDKIFAPLAGKPLLYWPLRAAQDSPAIDRIVLVLSESNVPRGSDLVRQGSFSKVTGICAGGPRRQDSVRNGLDRLSGCAWVAIHDAARPFLDAALIECGLAAARDTGAAIAAVPVKDTIKVVGEDMVVLETPARDRLWAAQTPQVFAFDIISQACRDQRDATDDASLVERMGRKVKLYPGSYVNVKVTTPEDMVLAELVMKQRGLCE